MATAQNLRESYEYKIPREDYDGFERIITKPYKKILTLCDVTLAFTAIILLGIWEPIAALLPIFIGAFLTIIYVSAIKQTKADLDRARATTDTVTRRVRFYDDFMVYELMTEEGDLISYTSAPLSKFSVMGQNDAYFVIYQGSDYVCLPKRILPEGAFVRLLFASKTKKHPENLNAPKIFTEKGLYERSTEKNEKEAEQPKNAAETEYGFEYTVADGPLSFGDFTVGEGAADNGFNEKSEEERSSNASLGEEDASPNGESETKEGDYVSKGASSFEDGSFASTEIDPSVFASFTKNGHYGASPYNFAQTDNKTNRRLALASKITFILSLLSMGIAMAASIVFLILEIPTVYLTLLLLPLPISSVAVAIVSFCKTRQVPKKNVIAAVIAMIFIFTFLGSDYEAEFYDGGEEEAIALLEEFEETLGIDLPEGEYPSYYEYATDGRKEFSTNLAEDDYEAFKQSAAQNAVFKNKFPSTYVGLMPDYYRSNDTSLALLYNKTTGEFNEIPEADGVYRMIYVCVYEYTDGTAYLSIIEYELEYTTGFESSVGSPDI